MESKLSQITKLEEKYFSLYAEKESAEKTIKPIYVEMKLEEGDWVYSDYFKEANKIKNISGNNVEFLFSEKNGLKSGVLSFVENRQRVKSYRYATLKEIEERLLKEIDKIEGVKEKA